MIGTLRVGSRNVPQRTCSKTVPVIVLSGSGTEIVILAIIDEQSNQAFLDQSVLAPLNIPAQDLTEAGYSICTLSKLSSRVTGSRVKNLKVRGVNKSEWIAIPLC